VWRSLGQKRSKCHSLLQDLWHSKSEMMAYSNPWAFTAHRLARRIHLAQCLAAILYRVVFTVHVENDETMRGRGHSSSHPPSKGRVSIDYNGQNRDPPSIRLVFAIPC
jgi:hypothetical protein